MRQISNSNKTFIRNAIINENKRIDFRSLQQNRDLSIVFGQQFGTCFIRLGQTIIFTTTSCEITEPKISRPSEGIIELSLDLCSGSEKWLDSYQRQRHLPEEGIHCLRLLERTIRDSNCVDTESLCLVSNEKVWKIKSNIICLNFDGNLCEAASIGAIASLSHFRRPDVSVSSDGNITIHPFNQKTPLKLSILHYPFCVTFVYFEDNKSNHFVVCDPLEIEEEAADGSVVVSANSQREILALHCSGESVVDRNKIIKCSNIAIERVKQITDIVKSALKIDTENRSKQPEKVGFANAIQTGIMSFIERPHFNLLDVIKIDTIQEQESTQQTNEETFTQNVYLYGRGIASIGDGGESKWKFIEHHIQSDDEDMQIQHNSDKTNPQTIKITISDDEEEEEITILDTNDLSHK